MDLNFVVDLYDEEDDVGKTLNAKDGQVIFPTFLVLNSIIHLAGICYKARVYTCHQLSHTDSI